MIIKVEYMYIIYLSFIVLIMNHLEFVTVMDLTIFVLSMEIPFFVRYMFVHVPHH